MHRDVVALRFGGREGDGLLVRVRLGYHGDNPVDPAVRADGDHRARGVGQQVAGDRAQQQP